MCHFRSLMGLVNFWLNVEKAIRPTLPLLNQLPPQLSQNSIGPTTQVCRASAACVCDDSSCSTTPHRIRETGAQLAQTGPKPVSLYGWMEKITCGCKIHIPRSHAKHCRISRIPIVGSRRGCSSAIPCSQIRSIYWKRSEQPGIRAKIFRS